MRVCAQGGIQECTPGWPSVAASAACPRPLLLLSAFAFAGSRLQLARPPPIHLLHLVACPHPPSEPPRALSAGEAGGGGGPPGPEPAARQLQHPRHRRAARAARRATAARAAAATAGEGEGRAAGGGKAPAARQWRATASAKRTVARPHVPAASGCCGAPASDAHDAAE
jgi:hypothetical protein